MTEEGSFLTLVPVNRLQKAKGRLEGLLSADERSSLAMITTRTVIEAARGLGPVAILTADRHVTEEFRGVATVLNEDPDRRGLNAQLEGALALLVHFRSVLILHADLPLATTEELTTLVARAAEANSVTIVRPHDGGTNAMLLRPPGHFPLAYGRDSCARHVKAAEEAGMTATLVPSTGLEIDIDTPKDIVALLADVQGRESAAGQYLLRQSVERRLS